MYVRLQKREERAGGFFGFVEDLKIKNATVRGTVAGGTDKKTTVDWVNGQDFIFTRMGTSPHTIGNCYIEYIMVSEDGTADHVG